ncbi:PREDICTED: interferon omega-1 [Dipodomys ordii]|uniref:Interferon omega-1 n=1 Tax=Dipodomys ordii TaxID=10020 RepID=A0A1S3FJP7_DIPOR|nr:PREDICTED: interferon omega-1 [Dipodomys ordii]
MALLRPLLTTMVLCNCGPFGSPGCHLPQNSLLLNRKTFEVLEQMRRISPVLCLSDRRDFQFPQEMVDVSQLQKARAVSVLHILLQQIFNLLHSEHCPAAWNGKLLNELHTVLHQQLEGLRTCLMQVMGDEESILAPEDPTLHIRKYFQVISLYLKEKKYSDCAWEIVRVEIVRAFSSLVKLEERLRRKSGDLGSS